MRCSRRGWNQTPQLSVFNFGAVDEEEISFAELPTPQALEHTLLSAATNDCKGRLAELLFAVRIGLPDILEHGAPNAITRLPSVRLTTFRSHLNARCISLWAIRVCSSLPRGFICATRLQ